MDLYEVRERSITMGFVVVTIVLIGLAAGFDLLITGRLVINVGAAIVFLLASGIVSLIGVIGSRNESRNEQIRTEIMNEQIKRNFDRRRVLGLIGSPTCNGDYSEKDKRLWKVYRKLEKKDDELTAQEREILAGLK